MHNQLNVPPLSHRSGVVSSSHANSGAETGRSSIIASMRRHHNMANNNNSAIEHNAGKKTAANQAIDGSDLYYEKAASCMRDFHVHKKIGKSNWDILGKVATLNCQKSS